MVKHTIGRVGEDTSISGQDILNLFQWVPR